MAARKPLVMVAGVEQELASGDGLVATTTLTATGTKDSTTFLRGDDTWATPAGGSSTAVFWPSYRSGYVYGRPWSATATGTPTLNQLNLAPWAFDAPVTIAELGFRTNAATTSMAVRIGVYADSGGVPSARLFDSGSIAAATNSTFSAAYLATLGPGRVWIGAVVQGVVGSAFLEVIAPPIVYPGVSGWTSFGALSGPGTSTNHYTQASVSGALPATFTASPGSGQILNVQIKTV